MGRLLVVGLISFLTLVDLFAAQAILPELVAAYHTTPAMMGVAVNASTIGMAVAGVVVALFSRDLDRRRGIWISLALLAIPTALLASAPDITWFMALRIAQGLCMATAFTLTMAYLAEQSGADDTANALAAYVTGNVMSNLVGRVMAAAVTDSIGLRGNFYAFAALNLAGAALVYFGLARTEPMRAMTKTMGGPLSVLRSHLRNPALRTSFGIGFLILFAFIATFTYVNFVLVRSPISLSMMAVGLVYFVFVPSVITTPLPATWFAALAYGRLFLAGSSWRWPACRCFFWIALSRSSKVLSWSAPERFSHKPSPPASSAAPPRPIVPRPAAFISPVIISAGLQAAWFPAHCSNSSVGRHAWRPRLRRCCSQLFSESR